MSSNKALAYNAIYVYSRLIIVSILGLLITRLALKVLGQSDYGLYNVVGGIIVILNIFSTAMNTTTRRFINIEMGKPNANLNKIFNICFILHIGFAIVLFFLAETLGLYYIHNFLNVDESQLPDAKFIFHISALTASIGVINVPFQALLVAYEDFKHIACIDVLTTLFKLLIVGSLLYVRDNTLILYAIGTCVASLSSFVLYYRLCKSRFPQIIRYKRYKDKVLCTNILVFNNYTAMGAVSYMIRSQGCVMLINYFFGVFVNGAYAVANIIETYLMMLVSNVGTPFYPQITQSFAAGDVQRSFHLVSLVSRYSILMMALTVFILLIDLEFILTLWLAEIPVGTMVFCQLVLISSLVRSFGEGVPTLVQAIGKIKCFQISGGIVEIACLPISILLFKFGAPAHSIIVVFIVASLINRIVNFYLLYKLIKFDVWSFFKKAYFPALKVLFCYGVFYCVYRQLPIQSGTVHLLGLTFAGIYGVACTCMLGLSHTERQKIIQRIKWC